MICRLISTFFDFVQHCAILQLIEFWLIAKVFLICMTKGYNMVLDFARFLVYKQVQVFLNVRYQCEIFFSNVKQVTKVMDNNCLRTR